VIDKLTAISEALEQTGFPFEFQAYKQLKEAGWNALSSRLYIDPDERKTREMDLLAYRATKGPEVTVYTALLISCKARSDRPWVLLTRNWPAHKSTWYPYPPVQLWTNSKPLNVEISRPTWAIDYFNQASAKGMSSLAEDAEREVFALQELEAIGKAGATERYRPKGDASLYESVMTLLKALAHEKAALNDRRGAEQERFVYQFNLVSLLDGVLYEANFDSPSRDVVECERYRYFARTVLQGSEFSARIDFCTGAALPGLLNEFTRLHGFNFDHFNSNVRDFYGSVLTHSDRLQAVLPDLERQLESVLTVFGIVEATPEPGWVTANCEGPEGCLRLVMWLDGATVRKIKETDFVVKRVQSAVQKSFRYAGPLEIISFEDDIPF
jgi:hypothetical protein